MAALFVGAAVFQTGCERPVEPEAKKAKPPATRDFERGARLRFAYRGPDFDFRTVDEAADVPRPQRVATAVYEAGEQPDATDEFLYVTDLANADDEEPIHARRMTPRDHFFLARAIDRGAWLGGLVRMAAQEHTQLDRRSHRSDASRKAEELLNGIVPRETSHDEAPP